MKFLQYNNIQIPRLGLGSYKVDVPTISTMVQLALAEGYRHLDTAQLYKNEEGVGDGIQESGVPRDDIFLVTKIFNDNFAPKDLIPSFENSLRKLKTDYVDLLLIHWPDLEVPMESSLLDLMKIYEQGKTRLVGVSNFNIHQLGKALDFGVPVFTNQVEFHPLIDQTTLVNFMNEKNISLTAYAPLARGHATKNPTLQAIGKKYDKSAAQVCLRWMMQLDNVIAIPKTITPHRLRENIEVFDFELSEKDMALISGLSHINERYFKAILGAVWDD